MTQLIIKNLWIFLLLFCVSFSYSQDIIIDNNKDKVEAKILEIDKSVIKYKKYNNLEGPTYTMEKSEIFLIIYENGTEESFDDVIDNVVVEPIKSTSTSGENLYIPTGTLKLSEFDLDKMRQVDPANYERFKKAKNNRTIWNVAGFITGAYVIGVVVADLISFDENDPSSDQFDYGVDFYVAGGISILSGVLSNASSKKAYNAISYHNQRVSQMNAGTSSIDLYFSGNGIALVVKF